MTTSCIITYLPCIVAHLFYTIWNISLCIKLKCAIICEDKCFSWIWYHWEGIAHLWHILSVNFLASKTTTLWILSETSPSHPSSSHITSAKRDGIKNSDSLAKVKVPINSIATKSKSLRSVHYQGKILILWYIWKLSKETKRNVIIRRDIYEHMSFSRRSPDQ